MTGSRGACLGSVKCPSSWSVLVEYTAAVPGGVAVVRRAGAGPDTVKSCATGVEANAAGLQEVIDVGATAACVGPALVSTAVGRHAQRGRVASAGTLAAGTFPAGLRGVPAPTITQPVEVSSSTEGLAGTPGSVPQAAVPLPLVTFDAATAAEGSASRARPDVAVGSLDAEGCAAGWALTAF